MGPLSAHLGALGMPGLTAYVGFTRLAEARAGQTVFVSSALGGVGAVVGQVARLKGRRVVGVSSSAEKCRFAVDVLGYNACVDRTTADFADQIAAACPNRIDVDFENAGGTVFWAAVAAMKDYGRMIICGLISDYNLDDLPESPDLTSTPLRRIALKRLVLKGLMVHDYFNLYPEFHAEVRPVIQDGRFRLKDYVV